jgi:hypothetical protein
LPELKPVGCRVLAITMVPGYLRTNQKPSYATNCIEDWEEKLDKIIDETLHEI